MPAVVSVMADDDMPGLLNLDPLSIDQMEGEEAREKLKEVCVNVPVRRP